MSYITEYGEAMDDIRARFKLHKTVSLYEAVVRLHNEYKLLEEKLQKSQEENKSCQKKPSKSKK